MLGLAGIAGWWRAIQRRRVPDDSLPRASRVRGPLRALPLLGAFAGLVLCLSTLTSDTDPAVAPVALVRSVTTGGLGLASGVMALAVAWHVAGTGHDPEPS